MSQERMDLQKLQKRVSLSTLIAFLIFAFVIAGYMIKLGWFSGGKWADSPDVWGQFGDYIGGLLNPLIAFLAFYWLTQSVLLQKEELSETRKALTESASAQSNQVKLAARTAEINASSALLASYNSDLLRLSEDSRFILEQIASQYDNQEKLNAQMQNVMPQAFLRRKGRVLLPDGKAMTMEEAIESINSFEKKFEEISSQRKVVISRLEELLADRSYEA